MAFKISTTTVITDDPAGADPVGVVNGTHNNFHPLLDSPTDLVIEFSKPVAYKQLTNGAFYNASSFSFDASQFRDGRVTYYLLHRNGATIAPGAIPVTSWANGIEPVWSAFNYWQLVFTYYASPAAIRGIASGFTT